MKSIFISYSENDADEVLSVISALTDEGYSVKYDEEMKGQANLSSAEEEEIENCGVLLAFISESSMGSAKCRNQVNFAISRSKSILSVFLAGATDEDIADMTPLFKGNRKPS